jgi:ketosteroid isomerase-like protein
MKHVFLISMTVLIASCNNNRTDHQLLSKTEMLTIVKNCEKQFSIGIQKRDSSILVGIYSDSAQYVITKRPILTGKKEIGKDWADFLRLKEKPIDLVLNIKDVRGNREIIYETGDGYTLLADSTKWSFNFVNVWRLQNDGSYKLEIDTYN